MLLRRAKGLEIIKEQSISSKNKRLSIRFDSLLFRSTKTIDHFFSRFVKDHYQITKQRND